jgi:peptidyl-prolyl isomerase H (cyclophilin H)
MKSPHQAGRLLNGVTLSSPANVLGSEFLRSAIYLGVFRSTFKSTSSNPSNPVLSKHDLFKNNKTMQPLPPVPAPGAGEPIVFFDITLGGEPLGRIKLHLFSNTLPLTSENFRQFCTGESKTRLGVPQGYKNSKFHRVIKGFMIQGGDFLNSDGTGSTSIYQGGTAFKDEGFLYGHSKAGLLSMANSGKDTNGCQFFLTCAAAPHLDGKHVVFGQVADGESLDVVKKVEGVRTAGAGGRGSGDRPVLDVRVAECGEM